MKADARRRVGGLAATGCLMVLLGMALAGGGLGAERQAPPTGGQSVVAAQADAEGQRLYLQSCASCHGTRGEGGRNGPSLAGAGPAHYDFYLRTGRMPLSAPDEPQYRQEPQFTADQIRAITAYAAQFGRGPEIPEVVVSGANLQRGWELYVQNCASCHSTSGAGGAIGGGFVAPPLHRSDPITTVEAMLIGPGAMPVFALPREDLNAIAAYVAYLQRAPSPGGLPLAGVGPVPEGFISIVFGLGAIVLITRWIARGREREGGER